MLTLVLITSAIKLTARLRRIANVLLVQSGLIPDCSEHLGEL